MLKILKDPKHPEHEDMLKWVGGPIDPEEFDIDSVNQMLADWHAQYHQQPKITRE